MRRPSILVVDDEPTVLRALRVALEAQDYVVTAVLSGEDALARVTNDAFDLVLLDLGLPGMSGFDVIPRVRVLFPALPIIVLSAQGEDAAKVEALDLGADDYVSKPFSVRELLARVRVALRHAESAAGALAESSALERGSIRLDLAEHSATVRGEVVSLTRTQFALLACFLRHPGRLLTHRAIVTEVWGDPDAAAADNLRVQISQLRRRIEEDPRHPALIVTEPGLGYRFLSTYTVRLSLSGTRSPDSLVSSSCAQGRTRMASRSRPSLAPELSFSGWISRKQCTMDAWISQSSDKMSLRARYCGSKERRHSPRRIRGLDQGRPCPLKITRSRTSGGWISTRNPSTTTPTRSCHATALRPHYKGPRRRSPS